MWRAQQQGQVCTINTSLSTDATETSVPKQGLEGATAHRPCGCQVGGGGHSRRMFVSVLTPDLPERVHLPPTHPCKDTPWTLPELRVTLTSHDTTSMSPRSQQTRAQEARWVASAALQGLGFFPPGERAELRQRTP